MSVVREQSAQWRTFAMLHAESAVEAADAAVEAAETALLAAKKVLNCAEETRNSLLSPSSSDNEADGEESADEVSGRPE